jgi:thiamine biosynthesis lipoprotein
MQKIKRQLSILLVFVLLVLGLSGCAKKEETAVPSEPITKTDYLLGTVVTITIYDSVSEKVLDKALDRIKEIENKMSLNIENSEVNKINEKAGIDYVKVSDETFKVIERGKYYSEVSDENFDITVGPLVELWGIGSDHAKLPSQEEIDSAKSLINYEKLLLDKSTKSIKLKDKGMIIDLGGIAKGYSADAVAEVLKENGVEHAIINLGGNILTMGSKPTGEPWKIGIQNPDIERGEYIGIVGVEDKTVVTSGIYERFFEQDGKKYHHILSPFTGYPIENSITGVSIITEKSIDADGLSTSLFALGVEEGLKKAETLEDVEVVFITKDDKVYITSGLKDNFVLTDSNFTLAN